MVSAVPWGLALGENFKKEPPPLQFYMLNYSDMHLRPKVAGPHRTTPLRSSMSMLYDFSRRGASKLIKY